jgi:thiamine biosynthesis lipoprotein
MATAAMATRFELLVLQPPDAGRARAACEEAIQEILRVEDRLSLFRQSSVVAELNREAVHRPMPVDGEVFAWLSLCDELHLVTAGAFDAALGGTMKALGFRGSSPTSIGSAGWAHVELDARSHRVRIHDARVQLDLGGIGKGIALDLAGRILKDAGLSSYLLHGGTSTVLASGLGRNGKPFRVGIQHPSAGHLLCNAALHNEALSVSGQHTQKLGEQGHVLNPSDPQAPSSHILSAVTHPSAAHADAFSTALLAGPFPMQPPLRCLLLLSQPHQIF